MKTRVAITVNKETRGVVKYLLEALDQRKFETTFSDPRVTISEWGQQLNQSIREGNELIIYLEKNKTNVIKLGWDYQTAGIVKRELQKDNSLYFPHIHFSDLPEIVSIVGMDELSYQISLIKREINDSNLT